VSPRLKQVVYAWSALLAVACVVGIAATSHAADWQPIGLVVLLAGTAVVSDMLAVSIGPISLSGVFVALVVAMVLTGPAVAAVIALVATLAFMAREPQRWKTRILDVPIFMAFALVGGLLVRALDPHMGATGPALALLVLGVFIVTNLLNFVLVAVTHPATYERGVRHIIDEWLVPAIPSQLPTALLAVAIILMYNAVGFAALSALVIVMLVFQMLAREMLQSKERAKELEQRTTQLASLQVGVLATLVQTLSLRDKMTARHSAAVARYSKAIADEIGLSVADQELVHTAGLLHDIGKFIFPDSILFANRRLSAQDWEIVKKHPAQGARLVARVEGYGPVANIILAHHERVDGLGYPNGLVGDDIPLLARIISVADTYDVMTARDSYRKPVSRSEALTELRRVSGTQLDAVLVEAFVKVLAQRGLMFQHTTDADFEAELRFDSRVRALGALSGPQTQAA
jgi:putative nucleotidyltransferase with HDIG domain